MQPNLHHTTLGLHSHARTFIGYRLDSTYMFIHTITVVYMYKLNGSGRHTAAHSGCVRGHFTLSRCHCINVLGMFFEVLLSASRLVILITASALPHTKQTVAVLLHSFHGSCFSIDVHCCTYIYIYIYACIHHCKVLLFVAFLVYPCVFSHTSMCSVFQEDCYDNTTTQLGPSGTVCYWQCSWSTTKCDGVH